MRQLTIFPDYAEFAKKKFIKDDVFKALKLGHSQANSYASMFNPRTVAKLPKIKTWLADPEGTAGERFRNMTIAEFKRYQSQHINAKRNREGKGKRRMEEEESDEEDRFISTSRQGKKGKARRVIGSSDLDMSE